jgi:hypothetical protein
MQGRRASSSWVWECMPPASRKNWQFIFSCALLLAKYTIKRSWRKDMNCVLQLEKCRHRWSHALAACVIMYCLFLVQYYSKSKWLVAWIYFYNTLPTAWFIISLDGALNERAQARQKESEYHSKMDRWEHPLGVQTHTKRCHILNRAMIWNTFIDRIYMLFAEVPKCKKKETIF